MSFVYSQTIFNKNYCRGKKYILNTTNLVDVISHQLNLKKVNGKLNYSRKESSLSAHKIKKLFGDLW
jgi:hypothetical protein